MQILQKKNFSTVSGKQNEFNTNFFVKIARDEVRTESKWIKKQDKNDFSEKLKCS